MNNNDTLNRPNTDFEPRLENLENLESQNIKPEDIDKIYNEFKFEPKEEITRI